MAFKKITENVENVSLLADSPSLTATDLKKEFDKGSKLIKEYFNMLVDELNNNLHPIGSIYISVNSENPTKTFGGIWESFGTGRTMVGIDPKQSEFEIIEKIGGEKQHALVSEENGQHSHHIGSGAGENGPLIGNVGQPGSVGNTYYVNYGLTDYTTQYINVKTSGNGTPHNNLQPYITVYMWKRIA